MSRNYQRKTKDVPTIIIVEPDWPNLINSLKRQGYTIEALARMAGVTRRTMEGIWKGLSVPSWIVGTQIITLGGREQ